MKTVVTHQSVDADAVTAAWLVIRFLPGWKKAKIDFVPAGQTLDNQPVDSNPKVIHVDTGLGKFDHHQKNEFTCAAKKVYLWLKKEKNIPKKLILPLERITNYITETDHFRSVDYPQPTNDRYDFCFASLVEGLKSQFKTDDETVAFTFKILDAALQIMRNKVRAEKEIKDSFIFQTKWGKSLAMQSRNAEATKLALKMGYAVVVTKDQKKGNVRIKAHPTKKIDLTKVYQEIKKIDKKGDWFLHISKKMLLNGSSKNPHLRPSPLSLQKIIAILQKI